MTWRSFSSVLRLGQACKTLSGTRPSWIKMNTIKEEDGITLVLRVERKSSFSYQITSWKCKCVCVWGGGCPWTPGASHVEPLTTSYVELFTVNSRHVIPKISDDVVTSLHVNEAVSKTKFHLSGHIGNPSQEVMPSRCWGE